MLRRMLAIGHYRGRVMLVDEATMEVRWDVEAHLKGPYSERGARVAMSPDGRFVASVVRVDDQWKLWDVSTGAVHMAGATHDGSGACICRLQHHTHPTLEAECPVVAHKQGIRTVVFSPCGLRFATGGLDGAVIVWSTQTGEAEHRMQGFTRDSPSSESLTYSADGARLASGSSDQWIRVWDTTTGALLRRIQHSHKLGLHPVHVQFSPCDNRRLSSAGEDMQIHLWDVDSGEKERSMRGRKFAVFSPDGRTIATGCARGIGEIHLLDAESGAIRFRIITHAGPPTSTSFSIDGSKLASASHACMVWDTSTGEILKTIALRMTACSVSWARDWVRDTQRGQAFAMGHHPRLGTGSQVLELEVGVVRMILDRV